MGRPRQLYSSAGLTDKQKEIRELAMADLKAFVALVAPNRMLGHCHKDMLDFLMGPELHKLVLWPRAHQKSMMAGYKCAWEIIRNPAITILYASDNLRLASLQLNIIKSILLSPVVKKYWPGLTNEDEGKRSVWRQDAISVDHWLREEEVIRDHTVMAAGIGTGVTGLHFDKIILDDIVVYDNSATPEERAKCRTWYSLLSSVLNPGGTIEAVGTRYHPKDLYNDLIEMTEEVFDEDGEVIDKRKVYTVSQRVVEEEGEFLWPRQRRRDGQWFGFNGRELAKKKASYLDKTQFYAQYYNDPTDPEGSFISSFEYYDRDTLKSIGGRWQVGSRPLNVFAAIDFASTVSKKADYTCIVVVGVDTDNNVFILDIDRFKTEKISEMQEHLTKLYQKWKWMKLRGEATGAQNLVVNQIKEMNQKNGVFYSIEIFKPQTNKEIRIITNLEPRYAAKSLFHYRGGNCQLLEDELASTRPPHDDIKDTLASVMEILIAPSTTVTRRASNVIYHPKWGGLR